MRSCFIVRVVLACGLSMPGVASVGLAQDPQLPEGLRHVPTDALGFVHVRVGDFLQSDLGKSLLQEVRKDREASKGFKEIEKMLGVAAEDLESVTLLMLTPSPRLLQQPGLGPMKKMDGFHPHWGPGGPDAELKKPIFEDKKFEEKKFEKEVFELKKAEEQLRRAGEERRRLEEKLKQERDEIERKREKVKDRAKETPIVFQDQGDAEKRKRELELEQQRLEEMRREQIIRMQRLQAEMEFQRLRELQHQRDRQFHAHDDFLFDRLDDFDPGTPLVIVTSSKNLDRKRILREQLFINAPRDPWGPRLFDRPTVLFVSDRTVVLGTPMQLAKYSEMRAAAPKAQPLQSALALGAEGRLVTVGAQVPAEWRRLLFSPFMPTARELAFLAPLLQTEMGMSLDLDKGVQLKFVFNAPTAAAADNALQAVKTVRVLGELAIEKAREAGESGGAKLELEKAILKALAEATVEQKGKTVIAQAKLELGPKIYGKLMKDIVAQIRSKGDRTRSMNNLKQIAIAMHNHHDATKALPPAGISDADGKPLLSWRVAILPYIEQLDLYRQFDLEKPWDHPTNKALIAKMPAIYMVPDTEASPGETHFRVLVGPGTIFEPRKGPGGRAIGTRLGQIPDGSSNTFMVLEATEPTIWTRPDDLPYNPNGPLPKFGTSPDGFLVAFADGSVRFVRAGVRDEVLRVYLTGNNGIARQPLPE